MREKIYGYFRPGTLACVKFKKLLFFENNEQYPTRFGPFSKFQLAQKLVHKSAPGQNADGQNTDGQNTDAKNT